MKDAPSFQYSWLTWLFCDIPSDIGSTVGAGYNEYYGTRAIWSVKAPGARPDLPHSTSETHPKSCRPHQKRRGCRLPQESFQSSGHPSTIVKFSKVERHNFLFQPLFQPGIISSFGGHCIRSNEAVLFYEYMGPGQSGRYKRLIAISVAAIRGAAVPKLAPSSGHS